jgi:hypothetical protein
MSEQQWMLIWLGVAISLFAVVALLATYITEQ